MRTNLPFFGIASIVLAASLLFDALEKKAAVLKKADAAVKTTEEYTQRPPGRKPPKLAPPSI